MTHAVAIDFGTSRTKLAYVNARGEAKVMHFEEERAWAPSLFYLAPQSEDVMWGYDAAAMLDDDPGGVVETLKRKLQTTKIRANGRGVEPQTLLTHLFAALRTQAGQSILDFGGKAPSAVKLTVPVLYGPPIEKVMREAATAAGFREVELITEPVAAARAWAAEAGSDARDVIVFDAGGGTIDWAWLRREDGAFRVVPECPPGGDKDVGGHHIDEGLLELVKDSLDREGATEAVEHVERERVRWLAKVRGLKEQFSRGVPLSPLRMRGHVVTLAPQDIENEINGRFIAQSCDWLASYLEKVRALAPKAQPTILLVGGSARLKGLKEAIERRIGCPTSWWERSEYATVLGAVAEGAIAARPLSTPRPTQNLRPLSESPKYSLFQVLVPQLGETVTEATVAKWWKCEGDHVRMGEYIVELETDKITVEIEAEAEGFLHILADSGQDVFVGEMIAFISPEPTGAVHSADINAPKMPSSNRAEASHTIHILMPALSPTITEWKLLKWMKEVGEQVKSGDVLCEIETDKATMEVEAVDEGMLIEILVPAGTERVAVNDPIAVLGQPLN